MLSRQILFNVWLWRAFATQDQQARQASKVKLIHKDTGNYTCKQ